MRSVFLTNISSFSSFLSFGKFDRYAYLNKGIPKDQLRIYTRIFLNKSSLQGFHLLLLLLLLFVSASPWTRGREIIFLPFVVFIFFYRLPFSPLAPNIFFSLLNHLLTTFTSVICPSISS